MTDNNVYEDNYRRKSADRMGLPMVSAKLFADRAVVDLGDGLQATIDGKFDHDRYYAINRINDALYADGIDNVVCWRYEWMGGDSIGWVTIANESALAYAESAVWDTDGNQLVAALIAATDAQVVRAIMAGLMTNSDKIKTWLNCEGNRYGLASAKGAYVRVNRSLAESHASGNALAVLHPRAGNPRETKGEHFYVVASKDEDLSLKFGQRLGMAVILPIVQEWTAYLLTAGREAGLVADLDTFGTQFRGLRVSRTNHGDDGWESVISAGIRSGLITV